MTEQEAYAKGLEKLGLWKPGEKCDWHHCLIPHRFAGRMHEDHAIPTIDLRQDPTFAWRVEDAMLEKCDLLFGRDKGSNRITLFNGPYDLGVEAATRAEALYAAVVALGREDSDDK